MDNSSLGTSFDFNSQAGVMAVLTAIRASDISSADKNELRDLVFLYTNGGGDPSIRLALEAKFRNFKIVPVATTPVVSKPVEEKKEPEPAAVVHPFGASRPAPVFSAPKFTPKSVTEAAKTAEQVPAPVAEVASSAKVAAAVPVKLNTEVKIAPEKSVVSNVAPVQAPNPVAAPQVAVVNEAPTIPSTDADTSKYLDRIREIKSVVNGKVGNPVNLVDINNEVGREYMNALLDAMKRLAGGAGQIEPAMARLELSFASVLAAIEANDKAKSSPVIKEEKPTIINPVAETREASVAEPVIKRAVVPEIKTESPKVTEAPAPAPEPVIERQAPPVVETPTPVSAPEPKVSSGFEAVSNVTESEPSAPKVEPTTKYAPVAPAVSEAPRILTPEDLPSPASLNTSEGGDPLYTREIDDGLEQLLSDWVLFKKSGLFGTGPKGREHPLFKKIAGLQITLLLAGRFEGSTQEIKQSITDYMNGWRYEQGIIYEQGEVFEHYLRRVIKQILDLQKRRRST